MIQQIFLAKCGCRIVPLSRELSYFRILLHCNAHGGSVRVIVIAQANINMAGQLIKIKHY